MEEIQPLLEARCLRCHADLAPAAGWSASSYLGAIGCTSAGAPVTVGAGRRPLLLDALDRPDHAGIASAAERAVLASWIASGVPRSGGGVHSAGFADPRASDSHGRQLRKRGYRPMMDPADVDACGSCHDGAPTRRGTIDKAAPNAPSCTSCHGGPGGALGCATCHGSGARAYPPRDGCFFPADPVDRAHAAHAEPSASRATGLACTTCHPVPAPGHLDGLHANGFVDVWLDYAVAGREARFEPTEKRCSGTCHARGGARPAPAWSDTAMTCNDCHESPPRDHYQGACTSCHREANADGTKLTAPTLHANGKVDLGDGSGRCGACHGQGDSPWPTSGAHEAHRAPANAQPVACETCHELPATGSRHPEGRGGASVVLGGLAVRGGRRATFDPATKTCAGSYCHEGAGGATTAPRWSDTGKLGCGSCHASPPPPPHVQSATCGGAACHEGRTENGTLTAAAKPAHVNGLIDRALP